MADSPEEIRKHVKIYLMVFMALMVLTVVTVGIAYLRLPVFAAVGLALIVASVKGTLVAGYFMHLIGEKKVIYSVLILTVVFFAVLMLLPLFTQLDQVVVGHVS